MLRQDPAASIQPARVNNATHQHKHIYTHKHNIIYIVHAHWYTDIAHSTLIHVHAHVWHNIVLFMQTYSIHCTVLYYAHTCTVYVSGRKRLDVLHRNRPIFWWLQWHVQLHAAGIQHSYTVYSGFLFKAIGTYRVTEYVNILTDFGCDGNMHTYNV